MILRKGLSALKLSPILLIPLLVTLSSCTPVKYYEIKPAAAELKSLKYYRWDMPVLTKQAGARAVEFDTTFRGLIEADMEKKGYLYDIDKAEISLDYRISVLTRPGMDTPNYSPHWTSDNRGTFTFTGWQDPQGTGDMLEHGVITLSMRSIKTTNLLWEAGVSKLLRKDESEVDVGEAAKLAANALTKKVPKH